MRIVRDFNITNPGFVKLIFFIGAFLFLFGEFLIKRSSSFFAKVFYFAGSTWFGIILIGLTFFALSEIPRLFLRQNSYHITLIALILSGFVSVYSLFNTLRQPLLKRITLEYPDLPPRLDGFKVVHLSDIHLNSAKSLNWLEKVVSTVNSLSPDLICITGDLIDADILRNEEFHNILKKLKAKFGVFAVSGNHEIYAGMDIFEKVCRQSGIRILKNEIVPLTEFLELAGIEWEFKEWNKIFSGEKTKFRIFLSHSPEVFEKVYSKTDLQLSGHTHAGQVLPTEVLIYLFTRYPYGIYKKENSFLYVTSGTSFWGPAMRFLSSCEIAEIVLKRKNFV